MIITDKRDYKLSNLGNTHLQTVYNNLKYSDKCNSGQHSEFICAVVCRNPKLKHFGWKEHY